MVNHPASMDVWMYCIEIHLCMEKHLPPLALKHNLKTEHREHRDRSPGFYSPGLSGRSKF
jgi:hypothetical protein